MQEGATAAIEVDRGQAGSRYRRELDIVHMFPFLFCFPLVSFFGDFLSTLKLVLHIDGKRNNNRRTLFLIFLFFLKTNQKKEERRKHFLNQEIQQKAKKQERFPLLGKKTGRSGNEKQERKKVRIIRKFRTKHSSIITTFRLQRCIVVALYW